MIDLAVFLELIKDSKKDSSFNYIDAYERDITKSKTNFEESKEFWYYPLYYQEGKGNPNDNGVVSDAQTSVILYKIDKKKNRIVDMSFFLLPLNYVKNNGGQVTFDTTIGGVLSYPSDAKLPAII